MNHQEIIDKLADSERTLEGIMSRFIEVPGGLSKIYPNDHLALKKLLMDLRDLLNNNLEKNDFAFTLISTYKQGVDESPDKLPSYPTIEELKRALGAIQRKISENASLVKKT